MSPIPSPARRARAGNGGGVQHLLWWWSWEGGGLLRKGKNPSRKIGRGERPYGFKTFFKFII